MTSSRSKVIILMADDDEDDCYLIEDALSESDLDHDLRCVRNGKELLDYLKGRGRYEGVPKPQPDLILLDLNMPVQDGRTTLVELKDDPELKDIPVVVLTESCLPSDETFCLNLGAASFLSKGTWLKNLSDSIRASGTYWFDLMAGRDRMRSVH